MCVKVWLWVVFAGTPLHAQSADSATYRMVGAAVDTNAMHMALHPGPLPADLPVLGRLLAGTMTVYGQAPRRFRVVTLTIPPGHSAVRSDTTHGVLASQVSDHIVRLSTTGSQGSGMYMHTVNGTLYLLPGKRVRIALEPSR